MLEEWGISEEREVQQEEYKPKKGNSIWEVMNASINKKIKPTQQEKEKISEFMFHKLLSRFENTLELALLFTTKEIPVDKQWDIVNTFVPKGFVPFEKQNKRELDGSLENVTKYYRCSEQVAKQYLDLIPEHEIERINEKYRKGKI